MEKTKSPKLIATKTLMTAVFTIVGITSVLPFFVMFVMGSYSTEELMKTLPLYFGNYFLENTKNLLDHSFLRYYGNSIFVSAFSILFSIITNTLVAYSIAKFEYKGRKFLETFIILTMMVPGQISTIGYILEMRYLHLSNTLWPLIFVWLAHPFSAFFMIQNMKGAVPVEIIESARIDGSSEPRTLAVIVLPLIKPALATVSILLFMWTWNNYTLPMLIINNNDNFTIPLFVANLVAEFRFDIGGRMAALTWAIMPLIIIFSIFSKTFIKGVVAGSVKG